MVISEVRNMKYKHYDQKELEDNVFKGYWNKFLKHNVKNTTFRASLRELKMF